MNQTKIIAVELFDGTTVKVEVTPIGEQQVTFQSRPFKEIASAIKSIAQEVSTTLHGIHQDVKPDKISVKVGIEIAIESGQLTALIAKGSSKANLEISMEWS